MATPLLAFKAGRSHRRGNTNFVDADPAKGAIYLFNEDGLLHFQWKNRTTNAVEEDLILFPEDALFTKVDQATEGRTYVLKFTSSNQRHFFWLQDASPSRDEEFVVNINGLLQNPEFTPSWNTASTSRAQPQPQASTSTTTTTAVANGSIPQATPEQMAQLQAILSQMRNSNTPTQPDISLRDVLTVENLTPLFTNHPELISSLFSHLPPDLPMQPSPEVLQQIIASPQFQASVSNFDQALHTGLLGGLVRGLGLPEEAGTGVEPFLRAVQEQGKKDSDEHPNEDIMDTD